MSALLEVKNLKKYFPVHAGIFRRVVSYVKAVDDISFTLAPGEVLGVVGESGSGKSTAARAAIRLIEPTSGTVTFEGIDLLKLSRHALRQKRREIQMVFQDPAGSLNPRQTIGTSLSEALLYHQIASSPQVATDHVAAILQEVGIPSTALNRYPHEFSGGQQQRICIGRALALKPRLIVCDESLSALDVSIQAQILNLLHELKQRHHLSYLFISHDLSVVHHLCDRVIVMHQGKIVEEGATAQVFRAPKHPYTQELLASILPMKPKR